MSVLRNLEFLGGVGLGEQVIAALSKTEQILISDLTSIGVKGFA